MAVVESLLKNKGGDMDNPQGRKNVAVSQVSRIDLFFYNTFSSL